jgi:hypothetical protein
MARKREEEVLNYFPLQTCEALLDIMHPSPPFTTPPKALHHAPSCWASCEISWGLATNLCFFLTSRSCFHDNHFQQMQFPIVMVFKACWWRCYKLDFLFNFTFYGGKHKLNSITKIGWPLNQSLKPLISIKQNLVNK